jgi:hypothetical protein
LQPCYHRKLKCQFLFGGGGGGGTKVAYWPNPPNMSWSQCYNFTCSNYDMKCCMYVFYASVAMQKFQNCMLD